MNPSFAPANEAACAPCGPECRYAQPLPPNVGDFIWCERFGTARMIGPRAAECPEFCPRTAGTTVAPVERRQR